MAVLSRKIKLWGGTYLGATQRNAINTLVDTYLLNAPDGIATGAKVSTDTIIVDEGRGAQMMIKAVAIGSGEGKTSVDALENVSKSFSASLRLDNLSADLDALEVLIQAWLDNSGDGIAAGAPVDVKISAKNIQRGVIELFVDVMVGSYSEYSYLEDYMLYVSAAGSDTTGTGTEDNPFLTPQAALDEIIDRGDNSVNVPYAINIGPGIFGGMNFNDAKLVNVTVFGAGAGATIIDPSSGNAIQSDADNDLQLTLHFKDLTIAEPILLEGASDATSFGTDLVFEDCVISDTVSITNAVKCDFNRCAISGITALETIVSALLGAGSVCSGALTVLGDNAAAKKPTGWAGGTTFTTADSSHITGDLTVDAAKNDAVLYLYGNIGDDLISTATRCYMYPGSSVQDDVTVSGVLLSDGAFIGGDLEFTSSSGSSVLFDTFIGGAFTIDAATNGVTMNGGGYLGALTDAGANLTYVYPNPIAARLDNLEDVYAIEWVGAAAAGNCAITVISPAGTVAAAGDLLSGVISAMVTATGAGLSMPVIGTDFAAALVLDGTVKVQQLSAANLSANTYRVNVRPI